jgi:hypothetical protein
MDDRQNGFTPNPTTAVLARNESFRRSIFFNYSAFASGC